MTKGEKKDERIGVEEKYKALVETAADAVITLDLLGRFTFVNAAGERISGYSKEELVGKHFRELLPAKYFPACLNVFQKALRGQPTPPIEIEMITKQGERVPLELLGRPVKRGRRVIEIIGVGREITERKQAEEALRKSKELFEKTFTSQRDAIFVLDAETPPTIMDCNPRAAELFGYTRQEMLGRTTAFLHVDETTLREFQEHLYPAIEERGFLHLPNFRMKRKDGTLFSTEHSVVPLEDEKGQRLGWVSIVRDITERKEAEEALRESEEKYRNLIERANDGIVIIQDTIIRYANPRLAEMWGGTVQEFIGTPFTDYVHPDDLPKLIDRYKRRMAGQDVMPIYETVLRRKDGSKLYAELNAGLITYQGKPADLVIVRDISERKRVEREIGRHHDELAALNAIAMTVTSTLDLQEVLRNIQERVVTLLAEKYPPVFGLFHEGNQNFEIIVTGAQKKVLERAEKLLRVKFVELTFPLATLNPALREALLGGKPYLTSDGSDILGPQVSRRLVQGAQRAMGVKSIVDLPLWAKGKFVGAMVLLSQKEKISEEEMELLSSIASQAAIAIENARLFEAEQRRAEELAVLNEIGRAVSSVMQLDDLLELISREASRLIDTSNLYIALYDAKKKEISFPLYFEEGQRRRPEKRPAKQGLTEYVIHSAKPLMINRDLVSQLKELNVELIGKPSKSWLGVPILSEERATGVMAIQDYQNENAYNESHLRLLSAIANQAAIAIENARLYEEERERRQEAETLHQAAQALSATLDLQKVLGSILSELQKVVPYDSASVQLLIGDRLEIIGGHGFPNLNELLGVSFPLNSDNPNCQVVASRAPFIVEDAPAVYSNFRQEPHVQAGIRAWLGVPLLFGDRLIGMITLDKKVPGFYTQEHAHLALAFAAQAAIAIENARLFNAAQQRIIELATFNEIGRAIASIMRLDELWELIYHQTFRVMEVSAFYIALYDREEEKANVVIDMLHGERQPQEEGPRDLQQGRNEYIIRTKKPLLIRGEVQETYHRLGITPSDKRARGFAGVPITAGGEVIGVLAVQNYERDDAYDEHTIDTLSAIANQAAIAIENTRLYEETDKRLTETIVLHKVAEVINATLDPKEVFQRVVEELSETFGYRLVDIYLLEEDGLRLQANVGYNDKTTIKLIPLERGVVGRVARTGEPAWVSDVSQDPDYIPAYPEIKSEICVPIKSGEALRGVLNVECDECRFLTEDDLLLLRTLSSHIGVAIENARLYEEEQRRSTQRRTIAEVGRRVASILEMEILLPQVVDLITLNFGYDHVHIFQIDPDSEYAIYKAGTGEAGLAIAEEGLRLKVGEEGIIGWVAQHGQPLLANDVSVDPYYIFHPALPNTRSELAVPIRVGGRIIGILDVQSTKLNAFDEGDLETLQTLADQLAVAMENARLYEETKRLAITDSLTGLYNLRYFYEMLEKEIRLSERYHRLVSLIILDIDDLKAYNDLYGHLAGDDLLRELAQLMSKVIRRTDILARYGGDEFAIILSETETEGARFLAERLLEKMKKHRFSTQDGQTIGRITVSLGVATYPHHADSAKALVDAADKALLRAKQAGKNQLSVCAEELTEVKLR